MEKWKSYLATAMLTAVVLFFVKGWLGNLTSATDKNTVEVSELRASNGRLKTAVDSLRWELRDIDGDIIANLGRHKKTLIDHEERIRGLERK